MILQQICAGIMAIGFLLFIGALVFKKIPGISRPGAFAVSIIFMLAGFAGGGLTYFSDEFGGEKTPSPSDQYSTGLTAILYLKDVETRGPIAGKTVSLFTKGTTLQDIQSGKAVPLMTCSAVTDSNGRTTFTGLDVGSYTVAFYNNEGAFDGTYYMSAIMDVTVSFVDKDLKTKECYMEPNDTLYCKKIGDDFYQISATSGTSSSSGGIDSDATVTENGTSGTTIYITISSGTNQAWLTDPNYICRVFIYGTYTDNGGANTAISLGDCRFNSSTGQNMGKDSSGTFYIDVPDDILKNTVTNKFQTFQFIVWCPDLGSVNTTADTLQVMMKYTLVRKDGQVNIIQGAGHKITITQA